jgi:prepilin-type N-terminal cleavage/methylation domain-containing protein
MAVFPCNERGFTLVEMIVVMLVFVVVIGITGDAFNRIVTKSLSLTKSAESNISGIIGLEILRADIESAGYGLPWSFSQTITYTETDDEPGEELNDSGRTYASDSLQNNVPRAVMSLSNHVSANPAEAFNLSDVLTIRSLSLATNAASKRWTYIESAVLPTGNPTPIPHVWSSDNLMDDDRVIMIQPLAVGMKPTNQLVVTGATWTAKRSEYTNIGVPPVYNDAEKKSDAYILYGVNGDTDLRRPFNRADYYIRRPAASEQGWVRLPQRCNPSTGVLFKGIVSHASVEGHYQELPLLECVMDMQVVYGLKTPGSSVTTPVDNIFALDLNPQEVREQIKEINVFILTHDGGMDKNFTYPSSTIVVGGAGTGRTVDLSALGGATWQNYRWKVYRISARPNNLAGNIAQ